VMFFSAMGMVLSARCCIVVSIVFPGRGGVCGQRNDMDVRRTTRGGGPVTYELIDGDTGHVCSYGVKVPTSFDHSVVVRFRFAS
jgi:hypothetical protein